MNKLKVLTVVGTRPEIIRLSRVFHALDSSKTVKHYSIHTGQNYDFELNEIFYNDLNIRKPDFFLEKTSLWAAQNDVPKPYSPKHLTPPKQSLY